MHAQPCYLCNPHYPRIPLNPPLFTILAPMPPFCPDFSQLILIGSWVIFLGCPGSLGSQSWAILTPIDHPSPLDPSLESRIGGSWRDILGSSRSSWWGILSRILEYPARIAYPGSWWAISCYPGSSRILARILDPTVLILDYPGPRILSILSPQAILQDSPPSGGSIG